ncbi:hypothetical protein QCA50_010157 [Cerrena zonata]|uniref:Uncharacterized protein n=1 Tax=Cerrena zonata TaxID=2478898 RepID=A0AAW0G2E7_9APHY
MPQSRGRPIPSVPVSVYTDASYPSQPSQPSRSSETSPSPSRAQIQPQVVDLDRIVELIARRIDPHPHNNQADRSDIPPPQYQHHAL